MTFETDSQLEYARSRIGFVILDSCRNNPFTRSFRAPVLGLARMDATRGTLIAYATSPGQVAYDGTGRNSSYPGALAEELRKPGVPVELMFKAVRRKVMAETRDKQVPWEASSLTGDFFFEPGYVERRREPVSEVPEEPESAFREEPVIAFRKAPEIAGDRPAAAIGPSAEVVFWMSMQNSTNKEDFEEYLRRFPDGVFEGLARRRTDEFGQLALAAERLPEPELEAVGDDFFALKTSNVRDRPSTQAEIVGRLGQGVPVSVRGKAKGINWYLVARNDKEFGYVHGNLLARLNAPVEPVGRVLMVRPVVYQARQMTEATRLIIAKLDQLPNTVVIESSKTPRAHDILISAEVTQVAWRQEINPGIVGKNLAQRLLGLPIPPTPAYTPSVDVAVLLTVTEARTGRILGSEVGRSVRQAQSNGDQSAVDQAIITAIFDGCGSGMANVSY